MEWLFAMPVVIAALPLAVTGFKGRWWWSAPGFALFMWGYVGVLFHEESGANSPLHFAWLGGLVLLTLGMVPGPRAGSWWEMRYGSQGAAIGAAAAAPFLITAVSFGYAAGFGGSFPLPLLAIVAAATVLVPIVGGLVALFAQNRTAGAVAVIGTSAVAPAISVAVAYSFDAFVFGF